MVRSYNSTVRRQFDTVGRDKASVRRKNAAILISPARPVGQAGKVDGDRTEGTCKVEL
ncbi:MAG: hypothetical protein V4615_02510 [Bacteroidota bacterium]